jgi:hypothetical protein
LSSPLHSEASPGMAGTSDSSHLPFLMRLLTAFLIFFFSFFFVSPSSSSEGPKGISSFAQWYAHTPSVQKSGEVP